MKYSTGEIGIYEPKKNIFGLYNFQGKTITYFKPTSPTYYQRQIAIEVPKGGKIFSLGSNIMRNPKTPQGLEDPIK